MNNNNDNNYTNREDECFYNFDSFVDPSMLLPEDVGLDALTADDFAVMDSIPSLPSEIPCALGTSSMNVAASVPSSSSAAAVNQQTQPSSPGKGPGSLYEKLTTTSTAVPGSPTIMMSPIPGSPTLYPYGSPYSMGSPSSLMMTATGNDVSWMHSNRPRRRRSTYSSPSMMTQTPASPYLGSFGYMAPPSPYANPMMMNTFPHPAAPYMMAPAMSPMNVTVKLPMVPLTPTNNSSGNGNATGSMKIPLVLPCHLQQQEQAASHQNSAAPNVSKLQNCSTASLVSSGVPSRCSSIAPNSSISSRSAQQNWFTEMSATKDRFLKDVDGIDFTNVTVLELKQILRRFGLNSTGKKAQLVERITEISEYLKKEGRKRVKIDSEATSKESEVEIKSVISASSGSAISAAV